MLIQMLLLMVLLLCHLLPLPLLQPVASCELWPTASALFAHDVSCCGQPVRLLPMLRRSVAADAVGADVMLCCQCCPCDAVLPAALAKSIKHRFLSLLSPLQTQFGLHHTRRHAALMNMEVWCPS